MQDFYKALSEGITDLLGLVVVGVGVTLWLSRRFEELRALIEANLRAQSIKDTEIEGRLDLFEHRIGTNKDLIEHRTKRFFDELHRVDAASQSRERRLENQMSQIVGWLDKNTEFQRRQ